MESRRLPERRPQLREPGADRFRRRGGEVGRQQLTAGTLESRDETLVLELQRLRRRLEVADQPMKAASEANTRSDTPESAPPVSRLPSAASASSTTTATGPMASSSDRTRSRFASVWPCHLDRKFRSSTTGMPISLAKHWTMKLLPVPTRPHIW